MFTKWKTEMDRYGITCNEIGSVIHKNSDWVENRLQGKSVLPIDTAIAIRNKFFKDVSYDYLFSNDPITKSS